MATLGSFPPSPSPSPVVAAQQEKVVIPCDSAPTSVPAATYSWSILDSSGNTIPVELSDRIQVDQTDGTS